jgi:hypothetical protein
MMNYFKQKILPKQQTKIINVKKKKKKKKDVFFYTVIFLFFNDFSMCMCRCAHIKINHISTTQKKRDFLLCMNSLTDLN